jgi:hypothetical protein
MAILSLWHRCEGPATTNFLAVSLEYRCKKAATANFLAMSSGILAYCMMVLCA